MLSFSAKMSIFRSRIKIRSPLDNCFQLDDYALSLSFMLGFKH